MNEFWNLISFEYKKILMKRSVQITVLLAVFTMVLSVIGILFGDCYVNGVPFESNYDAMVKDRAFARILTGNQLNGELIAKTAEAYSNIPKTEENYQGTKEYQMFARPYSGIYLTVRSVYNTSSKRFNMEDFQALTKEQADGFYARRSAQLEKFVSEIHMSGKAREQILAMDAKIKTPFIFAYTDGYARFFTLFNMLGLTAAFVIAICTAPLFAGEYTSGTDQLILSSKHGKDMLIAAKLFTGFSLAAVVYFVMTALTYGLSMVIFGSDGAGAPIQLCTVLSPYPLTIGQAALLLTVCGLSACLMGGGITMLLSAKLKTPFWVIVLMSVLLITPMLGSVSENNIFLYNLFHLLPTQMTSLDSAMSSIQYELFGLVIHPFVFLPLFGAALSILLTPYVYRSFKNHQIG